MKTFIYLSAGAVVSLVVAYALLVNEAQASETMEYKEIVTHCQQYKGNERMEFARCINHYITGQDGEFKP
jgi:DNA-directed RNA polymerase delta subunit